MVDFEQNLERNLFSQPSEKTFIDKLLAKDDINNIREIIKKKRLSRTEVLEVLYLLSSSEIKLLNLGEWDRYVILKYFVWIREFVMVAELLYDYQDDLKNREKRSGDFKLQKLTKKLIDNNERHIEHNTKFLIDLYFNICRSSLSIGATGFLEILKNKYEVSYTGDIQGTQVQPEKSGMVQMRK